MLQSEEGLLHSDTASISDPPVVIYPIDFESIVPNAFQNSWPYDDFDRLLTVAYLLLAIGLPLLGYGFMVLDFRRWLRSLRRALVVVADWVPATPYWALTHRPACLKTFGLMLPCSEEDVLASYRELAKTLHPDRGGDLKQFLKLQKHFEHAIQLVRSQSEQRLAARR